MLPSNLGKEIKGAFSSEISASLGTGQRGSTQNVRSEHAIQHVKAGSSFAALGFGLRSACLMSSPVPGGTGGSEPPTPRAGTKELPHEACCAREQFPPFLLFGISFSGPPPLYSKC